MKKKKNIKKYPSGGYLSYQEGFKGFGVGPDLYQDNSYFRSVVPDNIENMEEQINKPSIFSGINDVLGSVNQGVNQIGGLMSQIPQSTKQTPINLDNRENLFMQNYQSAPVKKLDLNGELDMTGIEEFDMSNLWSEAFNPSKLTNPFPSNLLGSVSQQKNGGYINKYPNGGDIGMLPIGYPEYTHTSNVFHENYNPVPRVHFNDDTTSFDLGVNLNSLVNMNGGKVKHYAGGGFAEMYGNSYGGASSTPNIFNANTGRATLADLQAANANDFLHTKVRHDRQKYQDDKVDWGFMNWAKEPVGAYVGMMSTVPILGDVTKNIVGDSFLTRTSGYQVGQGLGKTTSGAGKIIGGIATGNVGMIGQGVGDVGSGVGGTIGNLNAESAIGGYDKNGYISGKRMVNASNDFSNMMNTASSLYGNVEGGIENFNNNESLGNMFKSKKGGSKKLGGFGDFMSSFSNIGFQDGGEVKGSFKGKKEKVMFSKTNHSKSKKTSEGWLDQI